MQSRRSNTNLSYLTLAPLSSRLPLDDNEESNVQVPTPWTQRTSYIAGKSAPTTPGILSRTTSQTRLGPSTSTKLAGSRSYANLAFEENATLARSKSTTTMMLTPREMTQPPGKRKKTKSSLHLQAATDHGEWLYRAGAAITSEARESKGQSWLVSRESSTSLVAQDQEEALARQVTGSASTDLFFTPYGGRVSKNPSRMTSARTSRRGSKVGSRADLTYFATPAGSRSVLTREENAIDDYFGQLQDSAAVSGPDFVDAEEDDEIDDDDEEDLRREQEDEVEVAKLASDTGFGLGGVVDRLIGWTLFDVREDGHETEEEDTNTGGQQQDQHKQAPKRDKTLKSQQSHITKQHPSGATQAEDAQGGWADAAWLLSVASKVIL